MPKATKSSKSASGSVGRGSKEKYTDKQKRQAEHIEESYEERGLSSKEAAKRAWATVNKETGGANKGGAATKRKSAVSAKKKRTVH